METPYFLMSPKSAEAGACGDSTLMKVKVSGTESAYIAAATAQLAESLAQMLPPGIRPRVVAKDALPAQCYPDLSSTRVLLIDSEETLARYKSERFSTFPYREHIVSCQ